MKRYLSILLAVCALFTLAACGSTSTSTGSTPDSIAIPSAESEESPASSTLEGEQTPEATQDASAPAAQSQTDGDSADTGTKILIAFFSRAGENHGVGYIEKGNTHIIAEMIADETSGDLFHIERETPYPDKYDACTDEAKAEQNNDARPALKEDIDISEYDVIFLGYPNWWGDMPMPVYTFLEGHDFTAKTVIPFCTHAGSGLSGTASSIANITGATMLDGFAIAGTTAQNSQDEALASVQSWLSGLSLTE